MQEEPKAEPVVETPVQAKEVPFHKHPRWQRMMKELAEAREEARLAKEAAQEHSKPAEVVQQMPEAFERLFGSNEEAWTAWQKLGLVTKDEAIQIAKSIREEEKAQDQQAKEAHTKALQWAEDQFLTLSEETGTDFSSGTERNQVLDIIEKYGLYTAEGFPNIVKANELRAVLYPVKTEVIEEKRKVAAKTNSKSNSGTKESDIFTPARIKEIEKRGGVLSFLN